jgi:hypothetical protein
MGISAKRLRFEYLGVPHSKPFIDVAWTMHEDLKKLGSSPIAALATAGADTEGRSS